MATTTATAPGAAPETAGAVRVRFGMRGKMLVAFAVALTILFGFFAWFIVDYVGKQAQSRLVDELSSYAEGGARALNSADLASLLKDLPTYDPKNPYPTNDPRYVAANKELQSLQTIVGVGENYSPYTYAKDANGKLVWLTSWSAVTPNPPFTNQWRGSVADTVGEDSEAYRALEEGLTQTVDQPEYTDDNGTWISTYSPIKDASGTVIAGLAADFNIAYVTDVRSQAVRNILPLLLVGYLLLLCLVLVVSTWLTRPLKRLTASTERIAAGDYDVDVSNVVRTRIPDEMAVLAHSFAVMVDKVRTRERNLKTQVKRLTVEIDAKKREQAVSEITESDFFSAITAKAGNMRQRMSELESIDDDSAGTPAPATTD